MTVIVTIDGKQEFEHGYDIGKAMDFVISQFPYGEWPRIGKEYEVNISE